MTAAKKTRVTIYDVAELAGVSHQTVSRVINEEAGVRPATRQAVHEAVSQLGYRRRSAARSLATASSRTVALLSTGGSKRGPSSTVLGVHRAAAGRQLPVLSALLEDPTSRSVIRAANLLLAEQPMCLIAVIDDDRHGELITKLCGGDDVPLVLVGGTGQVPSTTPRVTLDQRLGAQLAVDALYQRGVRHLGFLPGPRHSTDAEERLGGVLASAERVGIGVQLLPRGDWTVEAGYQSALHCPAAELDGLIAANDRMAIGAIRCFTERGLRVPADIQVIGFDDGPEAALVQPSLTSIRLNFTALGVLSLRAAVAAAAAQVVRDYALAPQLIRRATIQSPTLRRSNLSPSERSLRVVTDNERVT